MNLPKSITRFQIMKNGFPSLVHPLFDSEDSAMSEVSRLRNNVERENEEIEKNPAKGHGACFSNMKNNTKWDYKKVEI